MPRSERPSSSFGVLELTDEEVADLNRRMVRSPCRFLPASYFPQMEELEKKGL
jgi:hypothetical protein